MLLLVALMKTVLSVRWAIYINQVISAYLLSWALQFKLIYGIKIVSFGSYTGGISSQVNKRKKSVYICSYPILMSFFKVSVRPNV